MNPELSNQLESLHPDAFGWALHCVAGDHSRAEEVLQNAYLKVAQGRARHGGSSSFKTWWFGVIRFTALEDLRRTKFRQSLLGRLWDHLPFHHATTTRSSPAQQLERREDTTILLEQLRQLPPRQAEVLHLVFYQDVTLAEAAALMGISLGSARQHYERGKHRLRANLKSLPEPIHV
jgi:RNA polymerase sigma-70 factor (ECF subfamily)